MPINTSEGVNVVWVIIDTADKANAFDREHLAEFTSKLREACDSSKPAVAIIGAGERYFSAGIDLKAVASLKGLEDSFNLFVDHMGSAIEAIVRCRKPVIAAVNGYAVGLGFEIVQASDLAYAVENAKLGSPALRWGMIPPATPFILYNKIAAELTFTGRLLTAEEAFKLGLINGVVNGIDGLKERVEDVAGMIGGMEEWAVAEVKQALAMQRLQVFYTGLKEIALAAGRRSVAERINKYFLEKKKKPD